MRQIRASVALAVLLAGTSVSAQQQQAATQAKPKEPGTATLISVLVTGGGQMYSDEVGRGMTMLGVSLGSIVLGAVASSPESCSYNSLTGTATCGGGSSAPLYIGMLVAAGTWVYSIMDAGPAARRYNTARGLQTAHRTVRPTVLLARERTGVGLALRF